MIVGQRRAPALALLAGLLTACTSGPDYRRPAVPIPIAFKEVDPAAGAWKLARPADRAVRGAWWVVFGDGTLDALMVDLAKGNQNLALAQARFLEAQSLAQASRAAQLPTLGVSASAARVRNSADVPGRSALTVGPNSDFVLPLSVSWELDLWGRVRRSVEATAASEQAAGADLESARLSTAAELALDYFELRALDRQRALVERTVKAYEHSYALMGERLRHGIATPADLAVQDTLLKSTRAQRVDLDIARAQFEHAIAALQGKPPADFALPEAETVSPLPLIPPGVPSALLERRPDVAAAERRMVAANAQIGVAKAAYFPVVSLGGGFGFEGSGLASWLQWPSRLWSFGPTAALGLFDNARREAGVRGAQAAYDGTLAAYRQTVLGAFQEVEDNLAALRLLGVEASLQGEAVAAARRSLDLVTRRYEAGLASALDLVKVQVDALASERVAVDVSRRQWTATVRLIKALGGGWAEP